MASTTKVTAVLQSARFTLDVSDARSLLMSATFAPFWGHATLDARAAAVLKQDRDALYDAACDVFGISQSYSRKGKHVLPQAKVLEVARAFLEALENPEVNDILHLIDDDGTSLPESVLKLLSSNRCPAGLLEARAAVMRYAEGQVLKQAEREAKHKDSDLEQAKKLLRSNGYSVTLKGPNAKTDLTETVKRAKK